MLRRSLLTSAIEPLYSPLSRFLHSHAGFETALVIIGGGLSGLAAAQSAVDQGAKPIVLEKEAALGGGGNFPEGSLGSAPVIRRNTTSTPPLTRFLLPLCSTITIALTRTSFVF